MKKILSAVTAVALLWSAQGFAHAPRPTANQVAKYQPIYQPHRPQIAPTRPMSSPARPPQGGYPPRPPHGAYPPRLPHGGGVTIIYQAPSHYSYRHESYSWLNGEPHGAYIESSNYVLVTNWRRLGLPAPLQGMYWIRENGRYVMVQNR